MNVDYVRQVAAECDELVETVLAASLAHTPVLVRTLARAATALHVVETGAELPQERLNGSGSVQDTEEDSEGQQGTAEADRPDEKTIRGVLWNHYPQVDANGETGSSCACTAELPRGWVTHVAHEMSKVGTSEPAAEQRYDELAKAACVAAGIVWPATHCGILHALQGIADEHAAWHDSWRSALEQRDKARAERDSYRKRWHEAATQRDALVQAAVTVLKADIATLTPGLDELAAVVDRIESKPPYPLATADRLRRELWHVLDRMPAGDDDLIAAVKKLKEGQ